MLSQAEGHQAFDDQERMRRHAREYAKTKARLDVVKQFKAALLDDMARRNFDQLLEECAKDADEIACEASEEATAQAPRNGLGIVAYELAYVDAYVEALPALMVTALARRGLLDTAA